MPQGDGRSCLVSFGDRLYGGWCFLFPYKHNHHHIIPIGAFSDYVINGGNKDSKVLPDKRRKIIWRSKWNINADYNLMMLPCEIPVAEIVGLTAHCPYNIPHHSQYSKDVKDFLTEVNDKIEEAVDETKCKRVEEVKVELRMAAKKLFKKIREMKVL